LPDGSTLSVPIPAKAGPLFESHRYKVIKGGRGKGGSWSCARALLVQGYAAPLRVLCAREFQKTIADSVHQLLVDQVALLGLGAHYRSTDSTIDGANGTQFVYAGLRQMDSTKLMSLEGVDRCWVEQGEVISKRSWEILIPTIRKPASEIWVNFNPQLDSDETYTRFVTHPPHDCALMEMSWRDNPWFPSVLEDERRTLLARVAAKIETQETYDNIWEGRCRSALEGAIYANEIREAVEGKRIRPLPYDPMLKVHTVWDLGWNDKMAIAFVQRLLNQVMVIDYVEDQFKKYDWYVERIKERRYNLGRHFLPHDAGHESPLLAPNPEQTLQALGLENVVVLKREDVEVGIKRVRQTFPRIYFDEERARVMIDHLKRYRRAIPPSTNEPTGPVHDEHSHASDVLRYLCASIEQMTNDEKDKPLPIPRTGIV
jgi:phage terminase large subunit